MYRHSTLTLGPGLRGAFTSNESRETAFGVREALRFTQAVMMMPHIISGDHTLTKFGGVVTEAFQLYLNRGNAVRRMLMSANRVTAFLELTRVANSLVRLHTSLDWEINATIAGYESASKRPAHRLDVTFHHRFGYVLNLSWFDGQTLAVGKKNHFCSDCHAQGHVIAQHHHRPGCPQFNPGNYGDQIEYERGYRDGYALKAQGVGHAPYGLGHDIGGLSYQADIACGRIPPRW